MTGAYLRVKREGKWINLEVEHLTDEERQEKFSQEKEPQHLIGWINLLCHKLVEIEGLLQSLEADGIIERRKA